MMNWRPLWTLVAIVLGPGPILVGDSISEEGLVHRILVIVGAPGEASYEAGFRKAAERWKDLDENGEVSVEIVGLEESALSDRDRIQTWLQQASPSPSTLSWLVYIGHGTPTQDGAVLNLKGPDLSDLTLSEWLESVANPVVVVHGGSAGASFLERLAGENRVIVSATRSSQELNYARFGERFAQATTDPQTDLNLDGQVSLLEMALVAHNAVQSAYAELGRLASEHALIEDNGDGRGTPLEWFEGQRLIRKPEEGHQADGSWARRITLRPSQRERSLTTEQRTRRNHYEEMIEELREQKDTLSADEYYNRLEKILVPLSELYLDQPPEGDS